MPPRRSRRPTESQVGRFHHEVVELIKKYQFRDRNRMTAAGVSVSQCYALECLARFGPQTMNELAERLYLAVSTLTRLVDQLAAKGLVTRTQDPVDRRVRRIAPTAKGLAHSEAAWRSVAASEREILASFPPSRREAVIEVIAKLNRAAEGWRRGAAGGGGS